MGFGSTITGGIQDVSALLPLLGTEQCEEHVGSALANGFLYASASSLSIFGSLGIVRAGFKTLAASIVVRSKQFMGAEKLEHAGFGPMGKVLSQIMWSGKCHAAEIQLTAKLEELHVTNMEKVTVDADSSISSWNWRMLSWSLIAVMFSITPYVYFIKNNDNDALSLRLFYPLARSIGSVLVSNMTQIIFQIRLLDIIKHRIVFLTLDDFVRANNISLPSEWWDSQFPSETALHHLEAYLNISDSRDHSDSVDHSDIDNHSEDPLHVKITMNIEKSPELQLLGTRFKATHLRHLPPSAVRSRHTILLILQIVVACSLVLTVVGYVGCFSLVQSSNTSLGPLIWLITEAVLSLVRMGVWAWNPNWDDTSLDFRLKLAPYSPLPTCDKFSEHLDQEKVLPLTRSREFLGEMTSFVGWLEPLRVMEDGVAVYYTLTRSKDGERVLYVTISESSESIARVFICRPSNIACHKATLNMEGDIGAVSATIGEVASLADNHITKDRTFYRDLQAHCDTLFRKLEQLLTLHKMTWALNLKRLSGPDTMTDGPTGTKQTSDMLYLRQCALERGRHDFGVERSRWVDECMSLIKSETLEELQQMLQDKEGLRGQSIVALYEAAVTEYFILFEWEWLEGLLVDETWRLEDILWKRGAAIIANLDTVRDQDDELANLKSNILTERRTSATHRITAEVQLVTRRLERFANDTRDRIEARRYSPQTKAALQRCSQDCQQRIREAWHALIEATERRPESSGNAQAWDELVQLVAQRLKLNPEAQEKRITMTQAIDTVVQVLPVHHGGPADTAALNTLVQTVEQWLKGIPIEAQASNKSVDFIAQWLKGRPDIEEQRNAAKVSALTRLFRAMRHTQQLKGNSKVEEQHSAIDIIIETITLKDSPKLEEQRGSDSDKAMLDRFFQAVKRQLANSTAPNFTPDVTEFTQHVLSRIDTIADPLIKATTQNEFRKAEGKLRERQRRVEERLRHEQRTMAERLEKQADDWYDEFLRQQVNFKGSSFLAHLALSKHSKFAELPREVMNENDTTAVANALAWNPAVSCVDCRQCTLDEVFAIVNSPLWKAKSITLIVSRSLAKADGRRLEVALREHRNVLSLTSSPPWIDMPDSWKQAIEQNRQDASEHRDRDQPLKLVFYESVEVTDYYTRGKPYLDFSSDNKSRCTVLFSIPATETAHWAGAGQLMLRLSHRLEGSDGIVDIKLNAVDVPWEQEKSPRYDFDAQDIVVPMDALKPRSSGVNELIITLKDGWSRWRDVQLVWEDPDGQTVW